MRVTEEILKILSELIEILRDYSLTEAINDVKKEYKKFVETEDPQHSELASKVIFKELNK